MLVPLLPTTLASVLLCYSFTPEACAESFAMSCFMPVPYKSVVMNDEILLMKTFSTHDHV